MPSVQIKDVPSDVHLVLKRRAAEAGKSMQEYLLDLLVAHARTLTMEDFLRRLGQRSGGRLTPAFAAEAQRAERDARDTR
jgi:plasmid stability protein